MSDRHIDWRTGAPQVKQDQNAFHRWKPDIGMLKKNLDFFSGKSDERVLDN